MATSTQNVVYQVVNSVKNTAGGSRFATLIGEEYALRTMDSATVFVWWVFEQKAWEDTKRVSNVKLTITQNLTTSADVRGSEIYISASYIEKFQGDLKKDFTGLIYFCMAQVWQWNANGQAPAGLLNGIADYVRMKADFPVTIWRNPGEGSRWDEGYIVTAHFLDFCKKSKQDFIVELNNKLRRAYNPGMIGDIMNNKPVTTLWSEYKRQNGY